MSKTSLRIFVTVFKQNKSYKDILFVWLMLIMIIFWMKLSVVKKCSLNGMWALIVMRNITYGNNHIAILCVVFHYIIIKYLYENVIRFFNFFCVWSLTWQDELVPKCIQQHKIRIETLQLVLRQWKDNILNPTIIVSNKVLSFSWNQISNALLYW